MVGPQRERGADLTLIGGPVIDASDTSLVPRDVIEHGLDNVRQHTEIVRHDGGDGAPEIMQAPVRDVLRRAGRGRGLGARFIDPAIEACLGLRPTRETALPFAEQIFDRAIRPRPPRHRFQDRSGYRC